MADSMGFSVVKPCQAPEFDSLCKMLPPATRHSFQAQSEVLKAVIDLGINAHDFTVPNQPEPAVRGAELEERPPEVLPAPATDPKEPEPPMFASSPSTRTAWGQVAGAATVVLLVAFSIAIFILIR